LPYEEKVDSLAEFFSDVEPKLRGAFTAAFGLDVGREICAETSVWMDIPRDRGLQDLDRAAD